MTISVGGNDAGFADVLTECALPGWASDCDGAIDGAQVDHQQHAARPPRHALRVDQRRAAPWRRWSWSATRGSSWARTATPLTWFSPAEESRLNQTADLLNGSCSRGRRRPTASGSPTRPAASSATRSATTRSGSTGSPTRSARATTPTSAGHSSGYAPRGRAGCSASRSHATAGGARGGPRPGRRAGRAAAAVRRPRPHDRAGAVPGARPAQPAVRKAAKEHGINLERWIAAHT